MAELLDNCRFTAGSTGTADFSDGPADASFRNLEDAGAEDGKLYPYKAQNATGSEWEIGRGTALETSGGWVLERTEIQDSSNGGSAVNFSTPPKVIVTVGKYELRNVAALTSGSDGYHLVGKGDGVDPEWEGFTQAGDGAVERAWQDKGRDIVSVKDFGAVGDGVADDTAAIQAAIDAVASAGGGAVYFPSNVYLVTDALVMANKVSLYGDGAASVIYSPSLAYGGAGRGHRQIDADSVSFWSVRDLCFDASEMETFLSGMRSILARGGASDYSVSRCIFRTPGAAVASIGSTRFHVCDNEVHIISSDGSAKHDGIIDQWGGCSKFTIARNSIYSAGIGRYSILVTGEDTDGSPAGCSEFQILNNKVFDSKFVGIWLNGREGVNTDFQVTGNIVDVVSDFFGIAISDCDNGIVAHNTTRETAYNGIRLYSETSAGGVTSARYVSVVENAIIDSNEILSTNTLDGAAITLSDDVVNCSVFNNIVIGTAHTFGVYVHDGASGNSVSGNILDVGTRGRVRRGLGANCIDRDILTADLTLYVRSDGNDGNDGGANTSGRALATIAQAVKVALEHVDTAGFSVTISVGPGTRTESVSVNKQTVGGGTIFIVGDTSTPSNCVINTTSANGFSISGGASVYVRGFRITTTTSGHALAVNGRSSLVYGNIEFGSCAGQHVDVGGESVCLAGFNYSIIGGALGHFHTGGPSTLVSNAITITLTGTPNFSAYFSGTAGGFQVLSPITFSGSATGKRFFAHKNGVIDVGSNSVTFLPGDVEGTVENGGVYTGSDRLVAGSSTSTSSPAVTFNGDTDTGVARPASNTLSLVTNGIVGATLNSNQQFFVGQSTTIASIGPNNSAPVFSTSVLSGTNAAFGRYSADANPPVFAFYKSRGSSIGTRTAVQNTDHLGFLEFCGEDGAASRPAARISAQVDGSPGSSDMPGRIVFWTTPDGSITPGEKLRIDNAGALVHRNNATTIVDANSHLGLRSYTVATLPSAASAGFMIYVSDGASDKRLAVSDGTDWRFPDGAVVS